MRSQGALRYVASEHVDRMRLVDVEESQHLPHRALVVGAKIVVDQHEHLLARKLLVVAAQLVQVAHMV